MESSIVLTIVLTLSICGSFLCSLTEAVLLSLSTVRLESLRRENTWYAEGWLQLKKNIERPISAILIVNTICNTGGATLAGWLFSKLAHQNPLLVFWFSAAVTLTILYLAEIVPKTAGALFAEKLAAILLRPLQVTTTVLTPLIALSLWVSRLLRRTGGASVHSAASAVDIQVITQLARTHNAIAREQESIIINAAKMRETCVAEIMIPVEWIVFFRLDRPVVENLRLGQHAMHTRYPVSMDGNPDNIHGYINYKDLIGFREHGNELNLEAFIRPIISFPEKENLANVLKSLSAKRYHIALVKNSEDKTVGMITLEDLIEELVGDIEDEFDQSSQTVIPITEGLWRVGANLPLERIEQLVGKTIYGKQPADTLARWLQRELPQEHYPGMHIERDGVRYTVQQARRGKIYQVVIELLEQPGTGGWVQAGA